MQKILADIGKIGIVPVIKIDDPEKAVPLARALKTGGIPVAEITFRTAQGEAAIRRISREVPDIILGAGTVLSTEQVDRALDSGAQFIVSPGFNSRVVGHALKKGIPVIPGCSSPSDIEQALEAELEVVKFFPAEQAGGIEYIKAVSAPYSSVRFIPTGGINANNLAKYTAFNKILACGGSWMAASDLINAGNFEKITALCKEAMLNMLGFSVVHLGVNTEDAEKAANCFCALFGFPLRETTNSVFAGDFIEIMRQAGLGSRGHIAMGTNSVIKAASWLERQGIALDTDSIKKDSGGNMTFVYLKEEIAGFAVHLVQKKQER
ncbi:MAG: bifunctional 4-hydroxy-2-oxoglutarate aldolase/2-dehydro-3-deoxy-phosphogluconate aldolase [Treponema sp.]|jgi:2-dehydro-3-deoxyphosphogluconate aldolase/(4S)-4-hydroxy-2-oxoglutarate aldolase|nr:bifunctional 4-hydroxy-2-oxoglutarate aldolase/2-dehydro-3-deoxy-phosphogluconate aldolase [Treponema sp.]